MGKENLNNWNYYSPTFEFTKELPINSSAWSGHYFFAYDLVRNIKPKIIVELGTHKGNSLFSMAQAIKDEGLNTEIHGVDTWEGDSQAGFYGEDIFKEFKNISKKYYKDVNIVTHKMFFDDALKEFKDNSIDILHIDGLHTYEAVKHDFETWLPKVKKDSGVIMFHDVCETKDDFGVYKLWEELQKKYKHTITFEHYHGLGVVFLEDMSINKILINPLPHLYQNRSKIEEQEEEIADKEKHIKNLEKEKEGLESLNMILEKEKEEMKRQNMKLEKEKGELTPDALEFREFKETKIWKGLQKYRSVKKLIKRN